MIVFKDWKLRYIGDLLARQNDNLSRLLLVEGVPDGYDWVMKVQVQLNGHRDIIPLRKMDGGVGVVLDKNQLAYAGYYSLQLMGTLSSDGVTTRHTNQLRVYIGPSLAGGGDWPEVPSEYTQFEDRLRELNQHPPVPGPNGYWMIWNTEADKYEESDFVLPSGEDDDPITPESIGAIPSRDKGKAGGVATLDSSGKVPSGQIPSLEYAAKTHASTHATGGSDPITPASIGAVPSSDKGKAGGVATLDSGGKVPSGQIPSLEYAGKTHANQHASGGSDPITPESIGAASKNLVESSLTIPKNTEDPASYLDNLLDEYIATKPNGSLGYVKIQFQVVHPTLGGGQYIASVFVIMQDYVSIEAISYAARPANNVVSKYTRSKSNGVWGEWTAASTASSGESSGTPSAHASTHATGGSDPITPASIGAAPDGYGLGAKTGKLITDGNDALVGGWFYWGNIDTNLPFTYGHLRVDPRLMGQTSGKQTLMQTAYSDNYQGCVAQRKMVDGAFKPWEWVNPPMVSGTEYRTTERHQNKSVYKKLDTDGVIKWRLDGEDTWKPEAESIGAVPAGYGAFGETLEYYELDDSDGTLLKAKLLEIVNTIGNKNTCHIMFHATPFVPAWPWFGIVSVYLNSNGSTRVSLDAYTVHGYRWRLTGEINENSAEKWSEVLWDDPPMLPNVVYCTTERYNNAYVYKKMDSDGVIWWSTDQSTWKREAERVGAAPSTHSSQHATGGSDPITPASIGAAPAGYGLGGIGKRVTDMNNAQESGFYSALGASNLPPNVESVQYGSVLVLCSQADRVTQVYFQDVTGGTGAIAVRRLNGNGWSDWEFINPPMKAGVEYRTTERYKEKAVYKKLDTDGVIKWRVDGETTWHSDKPISKSVTLSASGWNSSAKTQTTTVSGVLADETKQLITPTPAIASQEAYYNAGIRCTGQSAGKLTFTAKTIPTANLTVYVTIQEVGA